MSTSSQTIAVLGAGSWGTALAILLANNGQTVKLWSNESDHFTEMQSDGENKRFLPGIALPSNIILFDDLEKCVEEIQDILVVVPSHAFRSVLSNVKPFLLPNARIVWGTKGMDASSGKFLDVIAEEILGPNYPLAILSGPSFALDVAKGLPAAVTLAATSESYAASLAHKFNGTNFRVYTSQDIRGVEICGVVKNVLAIAAGISDGLGLGASALSALITRGLAEMQRLGLALGAKPDTFLGLAGIGDLILTCTDDKSRNRRFGKLLASGKSNAEAEKEIGQVVEGILNLKTIHALIQNIKISMPITEQVYGVAFEGISPLDAVQNLLNRELKEEGS